MEIASAEGNTAQLKMGDFRDVHALVMEWVENIFYLLGYF